MSSGDGPELEPIPASAERISEMRHDNYNSSPACPVEAAIEMLEGKWKGSILFHLHYGPRRFNTLLNDVDGVSARILTRALRDLEAKGLVTRTVEQGSPPPVVYRLSELGETLRPLIASLAEWGRSYLTARGIESAELERPE